DVRVLAQLLTMLLRCGVVLFGGAPQRLDELRLPVNVPAVRIELHRSCEVALLRGRELLPAHERPLKLDRRGGEALGRLRLQQRALLDAGAPRQASQALL